MLGYLLDKEHWGQGLMTEAVSCVVDYAFKDLHAGISSVMVLAFQQTSRRLRTSFTGSKPVLVSVRESHIAGPTSN